MNYENNKVGHPVLGILLAVLGLIAAVVLTYFVGVIATGIAVVLGALAILLGVKARKGGKGIGAIVIGGIAIIAAVFMLVSVLGTLNTMHDKAEKSGVAPLIAKYSENPYFGLVGILANLPQDEGSLNELIDEINELNKTE